MLDLAQFFKGMDPSYPATPIAEASPCALLGPPGRCGEPAARAPARSPAAA